jgi:hypothetical protein
VGVQQPFDAWFDGSFTHGGDDNNDDDYKFWAFVVGAAGTDGLGADGPRGRLQHQR